MIRCFAFYVFLSTSLVVCRNAGVLTSVHSSELYFALIYWRTLTSLNPPTFGKTQVNLILHSFIGGFLRDRLLEGMVHYLGRYGYPLKKVAVSYEEGMVIL